MHPRSLKLAIVAIMACASFALSWRAAADGDRPASVEQALPPMPTGLFSPSNSRTEDGNFIPEKDFFPAARCASCHKDTHAAWSESLHRNAGREPFYKESVDILLRTRGIEFTRHCESCHAPTALFSGALTKGSTESRVMDDEGVSCSVCHSITEARLDGTGSYTIRRPALLVRQDGTPVFGDLSDQQIMANIADHRRAMMHPLLKSPEFCASCHKSSAPPELNGYKFLRGFSAYDEWQQSGASHETVTPFYRRPQRTDCRSCHMPKVESRNDLAAKGGLLSSHRWLGANTAAPLFYGQTEQVKQTIEFLQSDVIAIDIFALRREMTGERIAPLDPLAENRIALTPGEEVTAEVVISSRKVGHSFPPELRDMYEPWVEFEAVDASGKTIFHSGYIKPDQTLDETAHVYKSILLDAEGRAITRHQVWLAKIKAYDNAIPPGRSDLVRYRFRVPTNQQSGGFSRLRLRARVNYRRFIQEYTDYVLQRQQARLTIPIVRMAEAEVKIRTEVKGLRTESGLLSTQSSVRAARRSTHYRGFPGAISPQSSRRWNDYGIALLDQGQYGPAAEAFRRASELDPGRSDLLVNAALAELRTERFGPEREQLHKAAALLDSALRIVPTDARARFYRGLVSRSEGKTDVAAVELQKIATQYPRDREVQRQLAQTLYMLGQIAEARTAFEAIIEIDPTDAGAYQFLTAIYASQGRKDEADHAHSLYLLWRDDPLADMVAARFFSTHPAWADERTWSHAHGETSPRRPTLTGQFAAPER